ncbi:MAG: hypothetical protein HDQ96_05795 [Lachnospiraceae bacterium]|nr:hypothetical protein [Lachnospiraceae bacterium]
MENKYFLNSKLQMSMNEIDAITQRQPTESLDDMCKRFVHITDVFNLPLA